MTGVGVEGLPMFVPDSGTATSQAAAKWVTPKVGTQIAQVYAVIVVGGRVTEPEIEAATGLSGNSVRPRLWTLQGNGKNNPPKLIEVVGQRDGYNEYALVREATRAA